MEEQAHTFTRKTRRFYRKFKAFPAHQKVLFIFILVLVLPLVVYLFQTFTLFLSRAASAQLSFSPNTISLPPNTTAGVVVNSGSAQIAFARIEITFDKTKVNLSSEINVDGPLKAVIGKTSMANANATGQIVVVAALCNAIDIPCTPQPAAPSGTFELFKLPLTAVTTATGQTTLSYTVTGSQLVDTAQSNVSLTATNKVVQLNPVNNTVTPTTTVAPTLTATTTVSPSVTTTRTPTPTTGAQADTTLTLSAANTTVNVGQNLPINVTINTGSNNVIGAELNVTYDKNYFTLVDITPGSFFSNPDVSNKVIDNTAGSGKITINTPPNTPAKSGTGTIAVFTFRALAQGSTRLELGSENIVAATGMNGLNALKTKTGLGITITQSYILGDINRDGRVDILDYVILFANFGKASTDTGADARADINNDRKINILDYTYVFENFGKTQ